VRVSRESVSREVFRRDTAIAERGREHVLKKESVCVRGREREREREHVCVCEIERARAREKESER